MGMNDPADLRIAAIERYDGVAVSDDGFCRLQRTLVTLAISTTTISSAVITIFNAGRLDDHDQFARLIDRADVAP